TFCVELAETFTCNTQYKVGNISRKMGATAWLFSKFIEGFNAGGDFVIGARPYGLSNASRHAKDARSLRLASWRISGQSSYSGAIKNKADDWINLANGQNDPDGNCFNVGI